MAQVSWQAVRQVHPAHPVLLVPQARPVRQDHLEIQAAALWSALLVRQARPVHQDRRVHQAHRGFQVVVL